VIIPWEEATIGGFSAVRVLAPHTRRIIETRVAALWPPGPFALAAAAVKVVDAIARGSRCVVTCFMPPDAQPGIGTRTVARPARIGAAGAEAVALPPLTVHDQVALDNVMLR
jgi:malate/lactate dehydrogenase